MTTIAPGSTIGILGGGQLGRMIAVAAAQLGYRSHIFAPEESGPAADVSPNWTRGAGSLWGTTGGVQAELRKLSSLPAVIYRPAGLKKLILAALLVP